VSFIDRYSVLIEFQNLIISKFELKMFIYKCIAVFTKMNIYFLIIKQRC